MVSRNNDFAELRARIVTAGLLRQSPGFYARQTATVFLLFGVSLGVLVYWRDSFWIQMLNAVFLAFAFGQAGFLMHDAGHRQFASRFQKQLHLAFNVLLGWSMIWWTQKHDRHHIQPNQPGDDDVEIRFLAFSPEQAKEKRGFCRLTVRYQYILFIPLLMAEMWHLRCAGIKYLLQQRTLQAKGDLFLIGIHIGIYLATLFFFLPAWYALAFICVHSALVGVYVGMAFAPNHKGMPMITSDMKLDYLRQQVLASRNVRGGWVADRLISYIFGGLNFQIEHHLFPQMSRNYLGEAARIVEKFCEENEIPYCAVGLCESLREIFKHLFRMSRFATGGSVLSVK